MNEWMDVWMDGWMEKDVWIFRDVKDGQIDG